MRNITHITLHCTAGPQNQSTASILAYWKSKGWTVPGYHHLISADGTEENLLPIERVSNGVAGHNFDGIHLCYKGGVITDRSDPVNAYGKPVDNRTAAQKATQLRLVEKYSSMFPNALINGHRDYSPDKNRDGIIQESEWIKACPSFSVAAWLKEVGFKSKAALTMLSTTANVNLRSGAGIGFAMVKLLPKGTLVKQLAVTGDWIYVEAGNLLGFVSATYLR